MTVWLSHGDDCPFSQALPRLFAPKRVKHLWLFPGKKGCAVFPLMAFPPFGGSSVLTETEKRLRMPWQEKVAKFVVRGPERFWQKHEKFMRKNENKHSRWFKVPFSSPSWRSLNPLKGSLNHPKKVTLNHQVILYDTGNLLKSLSILKKNKPLKMDFRRRIYSFLLVSRSISGWLWELPPSDHFGPSPRKKPSKLAQGLATATSEVSVRIVGGEVCSVPFCVLEKQWQVVVGKKGHRFLF